jgi:2-polyprenyl-6-methoxyphenol hydroxylase-like FAD-dependent oxidoreductase
MGTFHVSSEIRIRPADLYVTKGHRQHGVVMVGDAFATSCPAAGTGTTKVLTDVERLCNLYIPRWLATDGMDEGKIGAFYDDPAKTACDAQSALRADYTRSLALDEKLRWRVRRAGWSVIDVAGEAFPRLLGWLGRRKELAYVSQSRIRAAE